MEMLPFILQTKTSATSTEPSQVAGIIAIVITGLMLIGGIYVVVKYPTRSTGLVLGAVLMLLPFTGIILVAFSNVTRKELPDSAWYAIPVAWLAWVVMFIFAYRAIRKDMDNEKPHELFQLPPSRPDYAPDFVDDGVIEAAPPAAEPPPRRAVQIPAADSDSNRASEQTLKRMSIEKLEQAAGENKGPRANEVPENPLLPEEVVKIRCLNCDKKMKAEGAKFAKQRRCPNCKAAPFRFKIEAGT